MLGLNCAFGPTELTGAIRYVAENWPRLVSALPNAGQPIVNSIHHQAAKVVHPAA